MAKGKSLTVYSIMYTVDDNGGGLKPQKPPGYTTVYLRNVVIANCCKRSTVKNGTKDDDFPGYQRVDF